MIPKVVIPLTAQQLEYQQRAHELLRMARAEPLAQRRLIYRAAARRFRDLAAHGYADTLKDLRTVSF